MPIGGAEVARIHMHAIKTNLLNQIGSIIENQLHLSGGQRGAKHRGIGQQLGLHSCFISVFQQGYAGLGQRAAQTAQELCPAC
jgi:hypothetical protein